MEAAPLALITEVASLALEEPAGVVVWPLRRPMLRTARAIQARVRDIRDFLSGSPAVQLRDEDEQASSLIREVAALIYDVEDCLVDYSNIGRGLGGWRRPFLMGLDAPFFAFSLFIRMRHIDDRLRIWQEAAVKWLSDLSAGGAPAATHDGADVEVSGPRRRLRASDSVRRRDDRPVPAGPGFIQEYELLGMAASKERLLQLLLDGGSELSVIAVVGMGGVGKTTLAQAVFNDRKVTERFHFRSWLCISQECDRNRLLRDVLLQLSAGDVDADRIGDELLKLEVMATRIRHRLQNRRYVIVLDDVWDAGAWEAIKSVLPDDQTGSRILVTTRSEEVAAFCTFKRGHIYILGPLPFDASWELFRRFAFPSETDGDHGYIPAEAEDVTREIVEKCRGVPLAIKAMGSLMANTPYSQWKELLTRFLPTFPDPTIEGILQLSYERMPQHLRLCLLYLSIYPPDHKIRRGHLLRLWAAEGFVTSRHRGSTAEEVAEDFLSELINRSMVEAVDFDLDGRPRSLAIHDLIRDFIVAKSTGENFVALSSGTLQAQHSHKIIRRLSIIDAGSHSLPKAPLSHIRTLITFHRQKPLDQLMSTSFAALKVLKVVDLEGANLWEFPADIATLGLLRYLSLKDTHISSVPTSIVGLKMLETLDLRGTQVRELPTGIVGLERLRHLLAAYCKPYTYQDLYQSPGGVRVPDGIGQLRGLEKLSGVNIKNVVDELGQLICLRTLALTGLEGENAMKLCLSMEKLRCLCSLNVHTASTREPLDLGYINSPPLLLEKLYLHGPIVELPAWIESLQSLVKIVLQRSRMGRDPLKYLQDLPKLQHLELWHDVYTGGQLHFGEEGNEGFRSLRILELRYMFGLEMVTIGSGTLAYLEKLVIERCRNLKQMPLGLQHLMTLRELYVIDASSASVKRLQEGGQDWYTIAHIPLVQIEDGELV